MRKLFLIFTLSMSLSIPRSAKADIWGGDVAVLAQILVQTIQQLAQLKAILSNGQDTLGLLQQINQGINDSMALLQTIGPITDPGLYGQVLKAQDALRLIQDLYGVAVPSQESRVQQDTDQGVAEAIALNNSIYGYTREIDEIGEQVKAVSHSVSPGGAQKLTAQTLGVMLHVMNQSLRTQATGLKLQAQTLAIQNRKEKAATKVALETSMTMKSEMKNSKAEFAVPRF